MSYDVETAMALCRAAFDELRAGAEPDRAVTVAVDSLVGCASEGGLTRLRAISVRDDLDQLRPWMATVLGSCPADVDGLCFLLYEEIAPDDSTFAVCELIGGTGYPDTDGWMLVPSWRAGVVPSEGLAALLPAVSDDDPDTRWLAEYAVALVYAAAIALCAAEVMTTGATTGGRRAIGVAAGHHDGDIALVAEICDGVVVRHGRWL